MGPAYRLFLALLLLCSIAPAQQYVISTYAGGGPLPTPVRAVYRRALEISEGDPSDKDGLASNFSNLALLYMDMDRDKDALPLLERALAIRKQEATETTGLAMC